MTKKLSKTNHTVGILKVISETGLSKKEIIKHIEKGNIKAKQINGNLAFEYTELKRLIRKNQTHIGIWNMVNEILNDKSVFSINKPTNKKDFLDYLELNNWFGVNAISSEDVYFSDTKGEEYFVKRSDAEKMQKHVELWLQSYGCSDSVKMQLLLKWLKDKYPKTQKLMCEFILERNPNTKTMWILLDYLSLKLGNEILDIDEEGIEIISSRISQELPLNSAKVFAEFMLYLKSNKYMSNGWNYHYGTRSSLKYNNAYSMTTFLKMAYIVFNDEMWSENNLLAKAFKSKKHANLWAFVSLHFICGWRSTDIIRLPKPKLIQNGAMIREKILKGEYNTDNVISEIELILKNMPLIANKTKSHKSVSELKIFFPEGLRKPMGVILTVAASWCNDVPEYMPFLERAGNIPGIKSFFGITFFNLCDNKRFSTRRANKSYLQGIEKVADDSHHKAKGYMLAALARSHKGGIEKLPETTNIYLKDANFTGYTPEFIAKEMFERGVFSFIPSILLEMYSDQIYKKLHVSAQTEMITNIGVSATSIENIAGLTTKSVHAAKEAVSKVINKPEEIRGSISEILQNIASGNAMSKQDDCMCLLIAANYPCCEPERGCCIGCDYEIYTKAIIQYLVKEYRRLSNRKKTTSHKEAIRCSKILKTTIMPALTEIITSIKAVDPSYNAVQIIQGVLSDVTNKN